MSFLTSFCDLPQKEQFRLPFWWSSRLRSNARLVSSRRPIPYASQLRYRHSRRRGAWLPEVPPLSRESLDPPLQRRKLAAPGSRTPDPRIPGHPGLPVSASQHASPADTAAVSTLAGGLLGLPLLARGEHVVDEPVLLRLRRTHVKVAVDVLVDEVLGLAGRVRQDVGDDFLQVSDLAGLDLDVGR